MMAERTLPALAEGKVVVSDRFVSSTLAYQLGGDGLTADEIRRGGRHRDQGSLAGPDDHPRHAGGPSAARVRPKFTLPFPEEFQPRKVKDRIEQRPPAYHEQVRRNYLAQAEADPKRYRVIDAARTPEAVHADVWKAVTGL